MNNFIYLIPAVSVAALAYAFAKAVWIGKQDAGTDRMKQIAGYISNGAMSFLKAEYKVLAIFVLIVGVLLAFFADPHRSHWLVALAFVVGALFSALSGFVGMRVATKANVRTTHAARTSLRKALDVSFTGGSVMGISVVSIGLLGLSLLFILFQVLFNPAGEMGEPLKRVLEILTGFSLGAESIALFARVGGGIFTKAADVGADLVGKVEAGIPEDDPRNPAVIADNVGDNVGDVAGMGADLFGSYVSTLLATMVLGASVNTGKEDKLGGLSPVILPLGIAVLGVIFSIAGTYFVRIRENGNPQSALNKGNFGSILLTAAASYLLINWLLPATFEVKGEIYTSMRVFGTVVVGLVVGFLMSMITEFYCSLGKQPVLTIARQSLTGAATNIISGLSVGMISTALPTIVLAGGIVASYFIAGIYGVAIAASGMMATTGIQLAIDAFGPIADNAGGIAEMSGLPKEVREKTDVLDTVGNTTAAVGKGFAIASAALTSLALFAAFKEVTGIEVIDISDAKVLAGLFIGGMIPFLFSALAMRSVGRAANAMVVEVRRQFKSIPGLLEGKQGVEPDYDKCIQISTGAALRQMLLPGLLAIAVPVFIGITAGPAVLASVLAGVAVSGVLMAMFQSNAGGAWDNAKKSFEKGVEIDGKMYYKGSDPHKAAVTGDTVGDPFKDTSGPSMNILIKLTAIVSLIIAPMISTREAVKQEAPEAKKSYDISNVHADLHLDGAHTFIDFKIRHFISSSRGNMMLDTAYNNTIVLTGDPATSSVNLQVKVATINTQDEERDDHLMNDDFFNAEKHPVISFKSSSVHAVSGGPYKYVATGTLTAMGIEKQVDVPFNYLGETVTPKGKKIHAFEGAFSVSRRDFHIGKESPYLGDEVQLEFSAEASPR